MNFFHDGLCSGWIFPLLLMRIGTKVISDMLDGNLTPIVPLHPMLIVDFRIPSLTFTNLTFGKNLSKNPTNIFSKKLERKI